jgi:hypothetical protein
MLSSTSRLAAFAILCLAVVALPVAYVLLTRSTGASPVAAVPVASAGEIAAALARPHVLFRHTALDSAFGQVGIVALDNLAGPRVITPLACDRVAFAGGRGMCLAADRGMVTTYRADVVDATLAIQHSVPLGGVPSRTRVAGDGSLAVLTYFVSGDSYATGGFSTRTLLIEPGSGEVLANLEEFTVSRDGAPFKSADFNFWGVTFAAAPGRFYATLATGGQTYLIEGDATTRTARVIHDGVECPSLSPDNRRVAFKKRMPGVRLLWRIHVLDLETGALTAVNETRSVDDQVLWLDDATILYALPNEMQKASASMDVWAVPADGSGAPRLFIPNADSPAIVP